MDGYTECNIYKILDTSQPILLESWGVLNIPRLQKKLETTQEKPERQVYM